MSEEREAEDPVEAAWDLRARAAEKWDERSRASTATWVPPIMAALVERARKGTLGRFYPFTSHAALCFRSGPRHWLGGDMVVPVSIALAPGGLYVVRVRERGTVLETVSADEAVTMAEQLVDEHCSDGVQSPTRAVSGPSDGDRR